MFGKFVLLAIIGYTVGETCLSISGPCVLGMCPVGSCVANVCCVSDPAENCNNTMDEIFCTNHASACTDPTVGPQMKIVCARSCKSCNGAGTNSTGTPSGSPSATGTSDCPRNKSLCTNPNYKTLMQQQCPKTCGFC
ncbi:hypothetical protein FO519_008203 [Halicephalobus sp. NKZ332]|nr:hypothetical protein FO519_008203 [Halicephalobus sp. NKZ332]